MARQKISQHIETMHQENGLHLSRYQDYYQDVVYEQIYEMATGSRLS